MQLYIQLKINNFFRSRQYIHLGLDNNLGPNHCMANAPIGAVTSMEITEIVNNLLALSLSSSEPIILAISKATGARAAYVCLYIK